MTNPRIVENIEIAQASGASDLQKLDPRWVTCERRAKLYESSILFVLGLVALLVGPAVLDWDFTGLRPWLWGAFAVLMIATWVHAWCWPPVAWRYASWRRSDVGLEIRRGVLWRRVLDVPQSRVQHTDVLDGPLLRKYGLARLSVYTAGTQHAEVQLVGIRREDAVVLRDWLIGREQGDPVEVADAEVSPVERVETTSDVTEEPPRD